MTSLPADLRAEISQLMSTGRYESEAELLRDALAALRTQEADWAAVAEGIADLEAGRTYSLDAVEAEMQRAPFEG
jgi:Arc/MetJ-type ribon-helix-helix transcriptional regulator